MTELQRGISIVLPSYNGKSLLQNNLPGVYSALPEFNDPGNDRYNI